MSRKKLTLEQEELIISIYQNQPKITCPLIARQFNVTDTTIRNVFYNRKVPLNKSRTNRKITNLEEQIVEDYKSLTVIDLAKKYNISKRHVYLTLNKHNVKIIRKTNRNFYDESFFFKKTPEAYYFFGFLLGDGNLFISPKTHAISIVLDNKDYELLYMFSNWLSFDPKKIYFNNRHCCCLRITGKNFILNNVLHFKKFGLVPNKTYEAVLPDISGKLIKPFLVGLIDSDGCIQFSKKGYSISLAGNKPILNWVSEQFRKIGFDGKIFEYWRTESHGSIRIGRKNDVLKLTKLLNVKNMPFAMYRKWGKILPI